MAWALLLFAVLAHGTGSLVQAALTQPASVSVSPGETARITCSGSSYNYYGWYQQKPGSALVTVIYYNDKRPSNIPARFSGSSSGSTNTLTITGVQDQYEAPYYWGSSDDSSGALLVPQNNGEVRHKPWSGGRGRFCVPFPLSHAGPCPQLWSLLLDLSCSPRVWGLLGCPRCQSPGAGKAMVGLISTL
uniref:Immunoglobulin domain-containing protein n=1 Tax=Apteryx owenii TaxID=8824 RepID=A0A8B9S8J6_APTOW